MQTPRKNQKEMLEFKNTEMKNASDDVSSRLHMADKQLGNLKVTEISQAKIQREEKAKKRTEYQELCDNLKRCNIHVIEIQKEKEAKDTGNNNDQKFPRINDTYQTIDPEISENIKQDK